MCVITIDVDINVYSCLAAAFGNPFNAENIVNHTRERVSSNRSSKALLVIYKDGKMGPHVW